MTAPPEEDSAAGFFVGPGHAESGIIEQIVNNSDDPSEPPTGPVPAAASSEISPAGRTRPIPPAYQYIQVNGCKTPGCVNFGVSPREGPILSGRRGQADGYRVIGAGSTDLLCMRCRRSTRLKNNKSIYEERDRQGSFLWVETPLRCPDETCANHVPDRSSGKLQYRRFGKTKSGSDRWQCCLCKKTWSIGKPTLRQQKPHVNQMAFSLLMNKVPISRMMEILGGSNNTRTN